MQTNILILDDYNIFRYGLKMIIESNPDLKVIGEVVNADDLFGILDSQKPNVLLINLTLQLQYVLSVIVKIIKYYPDIPIVLLTAGATESLILECINSGVQGILRKDSDQNHLIAAISTVAAGERYLQIPESRIKSKIIQYAFTKHGNNHTFSSLTKRETEVLKLFAEGLTYKEVANRLKISSRTVESHKNNILMKLELRSITDIVKYAISHNLIEI